MARKAAAVKYSDAFPAPFIVAKGRGRLAERIIEIAEKSGVAVVPSKELAEQLIVLEPGSFIPEDCFIVVAELLTFVHSVHGEKGKK